MAFTEDSAVFINADTPGYVLATVGGVEVDALFDNGYAAALGIEGSAPSLTAASSSAVSSAAHGTTVVVGGVSYTVTGVEPDGTGDDGMTVLRLQEA
jgi:hypothetical protein